MSVVIRSSSDIVNSALDYARLNAPSVNLEPGAVLRDVAVGVLANEFVSFYILETYVRTIQSLIGIESMLNDTNFKAQVASALGTTTGGIAYTITDVDNIISSDLNLLVSNWNVSRLSGSKATGKIRLYRTDDSPMSVDDGIKVRTRGSNAIEFETIGAVTNQTPVFDSSKSLYYIEVPVRATSVGTAGNITIDKIAVFVTAVTDASSVGNPVATDGGTDQESDLALIARARNAWIGVNLDTEAGYENFVEAREGIQDSKIAGPRDPLTTRYPVGAIDIYILASDDLIQKEEVIFNSAGSPVVILANQPVSSLLSVSGETAGVVSPSNYSLVKDAGSFAESVQGRDSIDLTSAGLTDGEEIVLTYVYNRRVFQIQSLFDARENHVVSGDILIKLGAKILIDITAEIVVFSDFVMASVQSVVEANLVIFFAGGTTSYGEVFSAKALGEDIAKSDIISVFENSEGVDRVDLDTLQIVIQGQNSSSDPIELGSSQYARMGVTTWI